MELRQLELALADLGAAIKLQPDFSMGEGLILSSREYC